MIIDLEVKKNYYLFICDVVDKTSTTQKYDIFKKNKKK